MFLRPPRPKSPRRGVTLVEMLVTVALLVLMMTVIVQIFQAATGAVSSSRSFQDMDSGLRQLDATIRQDLGNVTARMTPPLDPKNNLGYFEYIENSHADVQGEDTDDCLRFTVKAPEGQIFTGRFYPANITSSGVLPSDPSKAPPFVTTATYEYLKSVTPITIQSQYAEVVYFLRNGNLYRRVLLVAPERQSVLAQSDPANIPVTSYTAGVFSPAPAPAIQMTVSWQGMNDVSARPHTSNPNPATVPGYSATPQPNIVLNTLGDLTNRENRIFSPRFSNDFNGDGIPDDLNGDSVPDFYPSLYFNLAANQDSTSTFNKGLIQEMQFGTTGTMPRTTIAKANATFATMAFPYIYPYAYSQPDANGLSGLGWIHTPDPGNAQNTVAKLLLLNHNPIDVGDSLPAPSKPQTWWGFPTWRETMSPNWFDPWVYPALPQQQGTAGNPSVVPNSPYAAGTTAQQAFGLNPFDATFTAANAASSSLASGPSPAFQMLPPMTLDLVGTVSGSTTGVSSSYRTSAQLYYDFSTGTTPYGSDTFAVHPSWKNPSTGATQPDGLWKQCWEDDLVMTGVRSFDVKAYDNSFPGYVDLGWGDDGRVLLPYNTATTATKPTPAVWTPPLLGFVGATPSTGYGGTSFTGTLFTWPPIVTDATGATVLSSGVTYGFNTLYSSTLAHEGRIPPLVFDNRADSQTGLVVTSAANSLNSNSALGDDTTSVVRLRRVWDTWSTDYSAAPGSGVNSVTGFPYGQPFGAPIYPSYPPPYALPLRGIQIQIRVTDPRGERVKLLTIRQDFSDKL